MLKQTIFGLLICVLGTTFAQVQVHVNLDMKHTVGGESSFDRKKWITVHSANYENDWIGELDRLDYLVNDLDAHLARETGRVTTAVRTVSPEDMAASTGPSSRETYGRRTDIHEFEKNQDLIIANQHAIYELLSSEEAGKRSAAYMENYFGSGGTDGVPRPSFFEMLNEPVFPLHDFPGVGKEKEPLSDIFNYHKEMAGTIKQFSPSTKVGGYVAAFAIFEENNFGRWNDRWKYYIDSTHQVNDFYSFHLYDFPGISNGKELYRSGANNEATFDMLDHYTHLTGTSKEYLISEYGSQVHDWYNQPWSAERDWLMVKAINKMLLQFLERPDKILKALPFTVIKAEWGFGNFEGNGFPYYWRMMRRANEPASFTGDYIWSEYIKFYELWSDVKGTRIDTKPEDINLQTDAYVDGNKVYLIVNNLLPESKTFTPEIKGLNSNTVSQVSVKHNFYTGADTVALTEDIVSFSEGQSFDLAAEGTMIIEYTMSESVAIGETSDETKYYATTYLQPITGGETNTFNINDVAKADFGEAVLKIGVGRDHGQSLTPQIKINGKLVPNAVVYRGDNQEERPRFFGTLEVDVPYTSIEKDNVVEITFPDGTGHISSCILQTFSFSRRVSRNPVTGLSVVPKPVTIASGKQRQLKAVIEPENATLKSVTWSSDNEAVAVVDDNGNVSAITEGTANVTVTTLALDEENNPFSVIVPVTVDDDFVLAIDSITVAPSPLNLPLGDSITLATVFFPAEADNKTLTWESQNEAVVTVTNNGEVKSVALGSTTISVKTTDGSQIEKVIEVNVIDPEFIRFDDDSKYLTSTFKSGEPLPITFSYNAGNNQTVNDDGIKVWLREITPNFASVANDYTRILLSEVDKTSGTVSTTLALDGVPATEDLPEGNFYFLFLSFNNSEGTFVEKGIFPINIERADIVLVNAIDITGDSLKLKIGETKAVEGISVLPENATDKSLTWATSDESVATVSNSGMVTAIAEGEATITARSVSNTVVSDDIVVSVEAVSTPLSILESKNQVSLYPNPSEGFIKIMGLYAGVYSAKIVSPVGSILFDGEITAGSDDPAINLNALEAGQYILTLRGNKLVKSFNFIISKN